MPCSSGNGRDTREGFHHARVPFDPTKASRPKLAGAY